MRKQFRDGNTMIAVETAPAVIDFQAIVDATEVIEDHEETMAPWDHCDGFEHRYIGYPGRLDHVDDPRSLQGWGRTWDRGESFVIQLADDDYGIYEYMRNRGATRQVACEAVALERRRTLAQIVKWYSEGWQWYGVKCEFTVLDDVYEASVWGIDDADYAARDVVDEIAGEVAYQLEKIGFSVTNKPEPRRPWEASTREQKCAMLERRLLEQSWAGEFSRK